MVLEHCKHKNTGQINIILVECGDMPFVKIHLLNTGGTIEPDKQKQFHADLTINFLCSYLVVTANFSFGLLSIFNIKNGVPFRQCNGTIR